MRKGRFIEVSEKIEYLKPAAFQKVLDLIPEKVTIWKSVNQSLHPAYDFTSTGKKITFIH